MTVAFSHLNVGIHTCSDKRTHSYFDWQLAALKKDNNGNPLCTVDGTIVK